MKNEDILSIVQELPLYVVLTLKRFEQDSPISAVSPNENNPESVTSGHNSPNVASIKV
jgi:hypothetical protein